MSADAKTVVIADDDPLVREAYKAALERGGYKVLLAEDGDQALMLVESQDVQIVLLDILMPRKDGLETVIELRRRNAALTIVAMSADAAGMAGTADFLSFAAKLGADGVLRKPFRPQDLFDLLGRLAASNRIAQSG
jgi:CheY-like chemotaxis protein